MGAINPIIQYPWNFCHKCNMQTIEIYSWHNYPQKYEKVLNLNILLESSPNALDRYGIYIMRCSNCGKQYKIYWENGIPYPNGEIYEDIFIKKFKEDSINGRPKIIDNIYNERMK